MPVLVIVVATPPSLTAPSKYRVAGFVPSPARLIPTPAPKLVVPPMRSAFPVTPAVEVSVNEDPAANVVLPSCACVNAVPFKLTVELPEMFSALPKPVPITTALLDPVRVLVSAVNNTDEGIVTAVLDVSGPLY